MYLSRASDYAIRAMAYLAGKPYGSIVLISDISRAEHIPELFLRKIIQSLSRAGLIVSYRGVKGGISLARPSNEITLLEIIETAQGKLYLNKCLISPESCDRIGWCPVHRVWVETQAKFLDLLRSHTLDEVALEVAKVA